MNDASLLRPAWTWVNVVLMIIGFAVFWPIGLFMLAYMIWGAQWGLDLSQWGSVTDNVNRAGQSVKRAFDGKATSSRSKSRSAYATGNRAFDDWRAEEIKRLEEERRKLDEAQREFAAYVEELQRAKDSEEFDNFRANWEANNGRPI